MPTYLPVDGRPLRVQMGTRPLDLAEWIEVDDARCLELAEKDRLLTDHRSEVLAFRPEGDAGSREVLDLLCDHLPRRFPEIYRTVPGGLEDRQRDRCLDREEGHPLEVAGRLVQEDLCLMSRDARGAWTLTAASVCFPSRWRLEDKIGRDLSAIHEPVPFYEDRVGAVVSGFFDRLTPQRPAWRLNWTLLDDPALFQPVASKAWRGKLSDDADLGELLHFRVERQTLRALPQSGDVLFTIRTYTRRLSELEAMRPGSFAALADTLETTPAETVDYKGWRPLIDQTVQWLRARTDS